MEHIYIIASFWLGLAVLSAVIAYHLRVSIALVEICVGVVAGAVAVFFGKPEDAMGSHMEWLSFLASSGAVLLTFLAGAELDPVVIRIKAPELCESQWMGFVTKGRMRRRVKVREWGSRKWLRPMAMLSWPAAGWGR